MKKDRPFISFSSSLLYTLYFAAGLLLLIPLRYYIDGTDMVNYVSIALKYRHGDIYDAINDYWSPLISWLMVPLLYLDKDPFFLFKIEQLIIGFLCLQLIHYSIRNTAAPEWIKNTALLFLIPAILSFGLLYGSPDLLLVGLLVFYINILASPSYLHDASRGIFAGFTGALIYLAKAFGFFFFIVHFAVITTLLLFRYRKETAIRRNLIRNYLTGMLVFASVSSVWITALTMKNDRFTISGSGRYNFALIGPENSHQPACHLCHPAHERGLFPPGNATAVNVSETPGTLNIPEWSPFESPDNMRHYLGWIKNNGLSIYYHNVQMQDGMIFIVIALLYFLWWKRATRVPRRVYFYVSVLLIYNVGYSLVIVNGRYIWINTILMLLITLELYRAADVAGKIHRRVYRVLFLALAFLIAKRPVKELIWLRDNDLKKEHLVQLAEHPVEGLTREWKTHRELFELIDRVKKSGVLKGRVANRQQKSKELYLSTSLICFYTGTRHYGELPDKIIREEGMKQLNDYQINYFLIWSNGEQAEKEIPAGWPVVFNDSKTGMRIYERIRQ